jgi:hypothetical protein
MAIPYNPFDDDALVNEVMRKYDPLWWVNSEIPVPSAVVDLTEAVAPARVEKTRHTCMFVLNHGTRRGQVCGIVHTSGRTECGFHYAPTGVMCDAICTSKNVGRVCGFRAVRGETKCGHHLKK